MTAGLVFDRVVTALAPYSVHAVGPNRVRAICPVCGNRNANTLSVGESPSGAVLMKCFKSECDITSICGALGLDVSDLFPASVDHHPAQRRRSLLSASQALALLRDEAQLVALVASDIARNEPVSNADCDRVLQAAGRIAYLAAEVSS